MGKETSQHSTPMSLPLVNETSHCRKKPSKNIPTNIEHLRTADHRYKQKNTNFIRKRGESELYPYRLAGAHMDKFRTKINFTLSFKYFFPFNQQSQYKVFSIG